MTLSKLFGWIVTAASTAACVYLLYGFGQLLLDDPSRDPLQPVVKMLETVFFFVYAVVLSGIAYVICRVFRI